MTERVCIARQLLDSPILTTFRATVYIYENNKSYGVPIGIFGFALMTIDYFYLNAYILLQNSVKIKVKDQWMAYSSIGLLSKSNKC